MKIMLTNAVDKRTNKFHSEVKCDEKLEHFFEPSEVTEVKSYDRGKEVEEILKKAKNLIEKPIEKEVKK